jgi:hypothetical protein
LTVLPLFLTDAPQPLGYGRVDVFGDVHGFDERCIGAFFLF